MAYLGAQIKKLGFGLMRLPMLGDQVDIEQTKRMVDLFLAKGFTYFDTAYGYLDGKSEEAAKRALVDRYPRESFQLATKLPAWAGARTKREAEDMFWTSLERTGAGYFDYYLLHNLGDNRTDAFDRFDIWNFLKARKEEGLIKHLGFSFHDKAEVLDQLLSAHPDMEFVQLQINYADWESPSIESRLCYETSLKHGKPVIIMEPVKGGALATPPKSVADIFRAADPKRSCASWAIRFAASLEGVITVLSGMSDASQMQDNLLTMDAFAPLTRDERAVLAHAQRELGAIQCIPCTRCQYCAANCPQGVAIPGIFQAMNNKYVYKNLAGAIGDYNWETRDGGIAAKCIACGQCEAVCPQHIKIIEILQEAAELFDKKL